MNERENNIGEGLGIATLLENSGKIIAVLTLVVATLITFTDVSLSGAFTESFTCQMIIMLLSSYLMYFSMEETGERRGETCEGYRVSLERYNARRERVSAVQIPALRDFLSEYSESDRKYRRQLVLLRYGISEEEYQRYSAGEICDKRIRRAIRRADGIRPVRLSPHALLNNERCGTKSELSSPEGEKLVAMLLRLLPTTVCTIFTVSVMLTAKGDLSASGIIEGILKISALPIIGFKGYIAGYKYTLGARRAYLDTRARIIEEFLAKNAL